MHSTGCPWTASLWSLMFSVSVCSGFIWDSCSRLRVGTVHLSSRCWTWSWAIYSCKRRSNLCNRKMDCFIMHANDVPISVDICLLMAHPTTYLLWASFKILFKDAKLQAEIFKPSWHRQCLFLHIFFYKSVLPEFGLPELSLAKCIGGAKLHPLRPFWVYKSVPRCLAETDGKTS